MQDGRTITIYTLQESCERLYTALMLYDWSGGSELHPYDVAHKDVLDKVRTQLNLKIPFGYLGDGESTMYWMCQENALLLDDS